MTSANHEQAQASAPIASPAPYTPPHHASISKTKPVRLLELGNGPHGKNAFCEFPDGWLRTIDLPTQDDAWHPLFSELPTADLWRLRKYVANPIIRHPDGTRTRKGALSFITEDVDRLGRWRGERRFDVPAEDYYTGRGTGYRCAAELLDVIARGYGPDFSNMQVIEAAFQASNEPFGKPSRRGAGVAFLEVVSGALTFMGKHAKNREYIAAKIANAEFMRAYMAEKEAKEKAAFVERMKAAKEAKRSKARAADA